MAKVIGIDLGTTNSLAACVINGKSILIKEGPDDDGLIPSVIYIEPESGKPLVGKMAQRYRLSNSTSTAFSIKQLMGRGKSDVQQVLAKLPFDFSPSEDEILKLKLSGRDYTAIELSAMILRFVRQKAEQVLGDEVKEAVITVPAYFNDSQRMATKTAGQLAGLNVLRIINEPTAAALAYGLDKRNSSKILVYDLGGGTFDVSVLNLNDQIFQVLSTAGNTQLGGDDFDLVIQNLLMAKIKNLDESLAQLSNDGVMAGQLNSNALVMETNNEHWLKPDTQIVLKSLAKKIKHELSVEQVVTVPVMLGQSQSLNITVTRDEVEQAIRPLVDQTLSLMNYALTDAQITVNQIDEIILVGGSTRIPLVKESVAKFLGKKAIDNIDPDSVVAIGAAIQADILAGNSQDVLLLDVLPLSLGIETMGGAVSKLIHRNSTVPAEVKENFTTWVDGQVSIDIHILQGEREMAADCRSLGRFQLRIPPQPAGLPRLEVSFKIDTDGILKVRASDLRNKISAEIEVRPTFGMTDEQCEKMLEDSFVFAEHDFKLRQVVEARNEAHGVIFALRKSMNSQHHLLVDQEEKLFNDLIVRLEKSTLGDDHKKIRDLISQLDQASRPFAERVMDYMIATALKNVKV